ncbi:MAG TPA: dihydroorotase [Alphaproteobacteria bacterium]|jgi:dihydroorotase|nr:dihydroorotase [Alphaproteobacteria bacterium]MDP6271334.1 dihydroorotase [Alphaproteobacteria bacterium]MDP7429814.1 dihydroorotase [Alphaproteobacteria bacterium]HJM49595.1 dihydroorotase [Alphaproteobacteria bacterium]
MPNFDLLIRQGTLVTPSGVGQGDVGIRGGRIAAIGELDPAEAGETIEALGLHVLPGVIDTQVHFREPGAEHKEDLEHGLKGAALGGVTAVFEMPNTSPLTTDAERLADKIARAGARAACDFAFYVGATPDNVGQLAALERRPGCCGVKVFMGSSTGDLLIEDDDTLRAVLASGSRRVAVHAEDESRLRERRAIAEESGDVAAHAEWRDAETAFRATRRLLELSRETGRRVHALHITTAAEMELLAAAKDLVSVEVTPQHLTLSAPECFQRLGSRAQMNPPIREAAEQAALWRAVADGTVDIVGSDHAPHTLEEKAKPYPQSPSGMPGVQTLLPVLLDHVNAGRLSLQRLVDLVSAGPARLFGIIGRGRLAVGYEGSLTLVDMGARREIEESWIASRCGWTPFAGMTVQGWPRATLIRGQVVMQDDELLGLPAGQALRFFEGDAA